MKTLKTGGNDLSEVTEPQDRNPKVTAEHSSLCMKLPFLLSCWRLSIMMWGPVSLTTQETGFWLSNFQDRGVRGKRWLWSRLWKTGMKVMIPPKLQDRRSRRVSVAHWKVAF